MTIGSLYITCLNSAHHYIVAVSVVHACITTCLTEDTSCTYTYVCMYVRMYVTSGRLPSQQLLEKYNLQQFTGLVRAVKEGNIELFHRTVDEYEDYFIKTATFIVIERVRVYVYRTFIKKYYRHMLAVDTKASAAAGAVVLDTNKVDLNQLLVAFRLHGQNWVSL
jgi:hypothetical protein